MNILQRLMDLIHDVGRALPDGQHIRSITISHHLANILDRQADEAATMKYTGSSRRERRTLLAVPILVDLEIAGEIPIDIQEAARQVVDRILNADIRDINFDPERMIAAAIFAERMRCKNLADEIAAEDRAEADSHARFQRFTEANHWNAEASGCDEVARRLMGEG